jgi:hypothetical protein
MGSARGPSPVARGVDSERPTLNAPEAPRLEDETGFAFRVGFSLSAALWLNGGEAELAKPVSFSAALGYSLSESLAIVAHASSWVRLSSFANEYLGAGVMYQFLGDMTVLGTVGVAVTRAGSVSDWTHRIQGLAFQADVGQRLAIDMPFDLVLGAHFQVGTPLGGVRPDAFTSLETGVFLAFGMH